jgi:transcriptional regulator with XRE-family HTH domain
MGAAVTLIAVAGRQARVGERLVALREDLGLSQEEAVARTDGAITLRQWQRWESGESEPYKRNLAKLSEVFDIPIGEFFGLPRNAAATQLDRIEAKLDQLLLATGGSISDGIFEDVGEPDDVRDGQEGSQPPDEDRPPGQAGDSAG